MCMITIQKWLAGSLALAGILVGAAPTAWTQTVQGPIFSTQTPALGIAGSVFSVTLPMVNTGGNAAANVQVTSVTFGGALTSPTLPISLGTLIAGATATLNLNFNDSTLTAGKQYLLTVRGNYQYNGATLGFALSRIITFGGSSPFQLPPNPLSVTTTIDNSHAVTQGISAVAGGTIQATGADGTVFTLQIPANALLSNETITLTPVSSVGGLPISGGLLAAVQFAPEGLRFQQDATLTIQPVATGPVNQQVGFGFHASGQEFYFQPLGLTEAITIPIHHFSGVGVGQGNPGNGGRPTSQEDRLESVLAPLVAQERSELFPNDPPVDPQLFSQMSAEAQQYYQQILAPLLHDAETDDTLAQVALNETTSWGDDISLLGFGLDPPFAGEISTFLTQQAPTILANVYDSAFNRCVNDSSESLRIEEGTKMIAAERDLELFGSEPNPNLSAQLTACMAGPLEMSFDSSMDLIFAPTFPALFLEIRSHVSAGQVRLLLDTLTLTYQGIGALSYDSFDGTFTPFPPLTDCGTTYLGIPGLVRVEGQLDLNIDPFAISDPSQITINLSVFPEISERITFMTNVPNLGCVLSPSESAYYQVYWFASRPSSAGLAVEPIPVSINNLPVFVNASVQVAGGTGNGNTTIALRTAQ
jgi:hypothetical protein